MKFKLIKKGVKDSQAYGHEGLKTGDTIELTGIFAEKAARNPDFEEVKARKKRANKG